MVVEAVITGEPKMNKITRSMLVSCCFLLAGCATITPEEAVSLQSRTYQVPKDTAFRAVLDVLQAGSLPIQTADANSGFISTAVASPNAFVSALGGSFQFQVVVSEGPTGTTVQPRIFQNIKTNAWSPGTTELIDPRSNPRDYRTFFSSLEARLGAVGNSARTGMPAWVDQQWILDQSQRGQRLKRDLQIFVAERQKQIDAREMQLKSMEQKLLAQSPRVQADEEAFKKAYADYQELVKRLNSEIQDQKARVLAEFNKAIDRAVNEVTQKGIRGDDQNSLVIQVLDREMK
jgi:Skp family chaperone for outer membrane proteins